MNKKIALLVLTMSSVLFGGLTYANEKKNEVVVIDVRTADEFQSGHVAGALNIDWRSSDFQLKVDKLDRNKQYKIYCRSGNRSSQAVRMMKDMGFGNVENIGSLSEALSRTGGSCRGRC